MKTSWKTTLFGLLAMASAGVSQTPGLPPWATHLTGVLSGFFGGFGLLFSRDYNVTSEQQGLPQSPPSVRPGSL